MKEARTLLLGLACGWSLVSCAGDDQGGAPAASGLPVQTSGVGLDPGPSGTPADVVKAQQEAAAKAMQRAVKVEEISLTLAASDDLAVLDAVNVDVISATAAEAATLAKVGAVKYRESRQSGPNTKTHTFRKGGTFVVKVPTIPAADAVLLWAELPAPPAEGADNRMLVVPLTLDRSDPAKGPQAHPITVRLTANGWVREG